MTDKSGFIFCTRIEWTKKTNRTEDLTGVKQYDN